MAATSGPGRIGNFVNYILGNGLSYNNEYTFWFSDGDSGSKELYTKLQDTYKGAIRSNQTKSGELITGSDSIDDAGIKMQVLCEEISLPGVSSATGQGRGIYQGVDFKYAHTKIYNDLSMSFICDTDYTPLRFFEYWFHYVYEGHNNGNDNSYSYDRVYTTRPYYDYCLDLTIIKNEDKNGPTDSKYTKKSAEYALKNCFPTSISSIPLNTGASQVVRFTVNLTYERWTMKINKSKLLSNKTEPLTLGELTP
jgi:hypothetical protein